MHFKLIVVTVEDERTDRVVDAARAAGATGATVIAQARGEGLTRAKTFFGLDLAGQRDVVLMLVEQHLARRILERIAEVAGLDSTEGTGIAFQIDVEDAVGVAHQTRTLTEQLEEQL